MRFNYYLGSFFLVIQFITSSSLAQPAGQASGTVKTIFSKFIEADSNKSVLLFTNRTVYLAGEDLWFTAFLINQHTGQLDVTTHNLFAELVTDKDSVVEQVVLNNKNMNTSGAFRLPETISSGIYWIRSYAASQLAGDKRGISLYPVLILNKFLHDENLFIRQFENNLKKTKPTGPLIEFYPERVTGIPGIESTGVLEFRDINNNPVVAEGELQNSKGNTIIYFKTSPSGMTRINYLNNTIENYTAVFHVNDGVFKKALPPVNHHAMQLSVASRTADSVKVYVTLEDSVVENMATTIMAVQKNQLYFAAQGYGSYGINIPTDSFPGGIMRLLLFDRDQKLVDERKIYVPGRSPELEIDPGKSSFGRREKVPVQIKVKNADGHPLVSALTVAVENDWIKNISDSVDAIIAPSSGDLALGAWLNRNSNRYSMEDIDLLLVSKKNKPVPAYAGIKTNTSEYEDSKKLLNISGKIINRKNEAVPGRLVTEMVLKNQDVFSDVDTTDAEGRFSLPVPQGVDSLELSLQVTDKRMNKNNTDSIEIDIFQFPVFATPPLLKQDFVATNTRTIELVRKSLADTTVIPWNKWMLPRVTVKALLANGPNYDTTKRINPMSSIITSDKFRYGGSGAIGNAVLSVPGVSLLFGDISINGPDVDLRGRIGRPLVVVDGYQVSVSNILEYLNSLNPANIDFVEVLRGAESGIYGNRGAYGAISINSKNGPDRAGFGTNNFRVISPLTYHVCPYFNMPDYSTAEGKNSTENDPRTSIYWKGDIVTDTSGEARVNFYTADNKAGYTITVTGLTRNGDLVYKRVYISNTGHNR